MGILVEEGCHFVLVWADRSGNTYVRTHESDEDRKVRALDVLSPQFQSELDCGFEKEFDKAYTELVASISQRFMVQILSLWINKAHPDKRLKHPYSEATKLPSYWPRKKDRKDDLVCSYTMPRYLRKEGRYSSRFSNRKAYDPENAECCSDIFCAMMFQKMICKGSITTSRSII